MQTALDSGMPIPLSFDDFDTKAPSNVNDIELTESSELIQPQSQDEVTDMSMQILLNKYLRTRVDIICGLTRMNSGMKYEHVLRLSSMINDACKEARKLGQQNSTSMTWTFKHNLTDLFLRRFLLSLHQPFAERARTDPQFHFSRKVRLDAAMALLAPKQDEDFSRLTAGGGGIFKSRIRQSALTVSSELLAEVEEDNNLAQLPATGMRRMLIDVVKDAAEQKAERLRLGETNARLHITLSMIICRAESVSDERSTEVEMAQCAKKSLEQSLSIMQAAAELSPASCCHSELDITSENFIQPEFDPDLDLFDFLDDHGAVVDRFAFI